jgi:hypothetical protein
MIRRESDEEAPTTLSSKGPNTAPSRKVPNANPCHSEKYVNVTGSLTSTVTTPSSRVPNTFKKTTSTRKVTPNVPLCTQASSSKVTNAAPSRKVQNANPCHSEKSVDVAGSLTSTVTTPSSRVPNTFKKTTSTRKVTPNVPLCTPFCGKNRYATLDLEPAVQSTTPSPALTPVKVEKAPATPVASEGFKTVQRKKQTRRAPAPLVATEHTVLVTINGSQVLLCKTLINYCRTRKDEDKCKHPRNHPAYPHHDVPICQAFLNGECKHGDSCRYPHPVELAPAPKPSAPKAAAGSSGAPTTAAGDSKKFTAMCLDHVLHELTGSEDCKHGARCSFAHHVSKVVSYDFLKKLDDALVPGAAKLPIQEIFETVYKVIATNFDFINQCRLEDGKPRVTLPEPVPKNFSEILNIWTSAAGIARKLNKQNSLGLFEGPDSANENMVWAMARRVHFCEQDINCEFQRHTVGKAARITKDDVCTHGPNCKRGVHPSTVNPATGILKLICKDELCGNCTCKITSSIQAIEKRAALETKLNQLKTQHADLIADKCSSPKEIDNQIKKVNNAIETVAWELVNTFRKVHLIRDLGYTPLKAIDLNRKEKVEMPQAADFQDLPKMSAQQLADMQASDSAFRERYEKIMQKKARIAKAEALIQKVIRRRKFNALLKDIKPEDPVHLVFVMTQAYNYMSIDQFVADFKRDRIFANWYNKSLGCDFPTFERDVRTKMLVWESMGIEQHVFKADHETEEDRVEEFTIPSDKDNFRNFWTWYYGVPLMSDPAVVGTAADLAEDIPSLFQEYKEANPTFRITFSDWIDSNPLFAEAVKVYRESGINFTAATCYIKLGVASTGMTPQVFSMCNHNDVADWIKVLKDSSIVSETKLSFEEFSENKVKYVEFYLRGWWKVYEKEGKTINDFLQDKKEGWKHTKSGFSQRISEELTAKQQAKVDKKKFDADFAKHDLVKLFFGSASSAPAPVSAPKPVIKQAVKPVAKPAPKLDLESETTFAPLADDDIDFDFNGMSAFKTKKTLPLASMMVLGNRFKHHIFREQNMESREKGDVCVRKIWIGPFADKTTASKVLQEIREYNRENAGRGMHLKITDIPAVEKESAQGFFVVYGDSVNGRYEKDTSYDWYLELIPQLCSSVLSDVEPCQFTTNIESLRSQFMTEFEKDDEEEDESEETTQQCSQESGKGWWQVDDEEEKPAAPSTPAPSTSAPVTSAPVTSAPVTSVAAATKPKKNDQDVKAILLAKKQAREAEKVAEAERKKAAKQIRSAPAAPAAPAPASAPAAPKKTKSKGKFLMVDREIDIEAI